MLSSRVELPFKLLFLSAFLFSSTILKAETLKLLTWGGYAPLKVIELFRDKTGIEVKVTKSNNEEMISKLRATRGAGFDLVQPSQDRITGAQQAFKIYQPIDLSKIQLELFIQSILEGTKKNSTVKEKVYAIPHVWGTNGLIINKKKAGNVADYTDLCTPELSGRVSYRLKRPTLIGFAYAIGEDPFAAYRDQNKYEAILNKVKDKLIACKSNIKTYWSGSDALLSMIRSGEVIAAMGWDTGGWKLNKENPDIVYITPKSGALGWVDTFAIPAKAKNVDAAYKWINFVMQPKIAAMITNSVGNFTASKGADQYVDAELKAQFKQSFPQQALDNIKWYPPVPSGLEFYEGKVLDRVKAAKS